VEEDEALDVGGVGLFGADAIVEEPDLAAHAVE
jgi:hypothetical protein